MAAHRRRPRLGRRRDSALRRAAGWADGTLDAFTLARVLRRHELKTGLSGHVITGGGGEHFNSFPWQQEFLRAGRRRAVNYDALLSMRYLKQVDTGMLGQDPDADVREYFRERLSDRAGPYRGTPNTTQLDVIYAYKSVGHFGAYRSAGEGIVRTDIPCYYRDLFVSAFSADHRWRNNHRLQRRVIARLSPVLAALPTTRGGSAQPITARNAHQLVPYYASVAQRAVRKLSRLGKPALPAALGADLVDYYRRGAEALQRERTCSRSATCSRPGSTNRPSSNRSLHGLPPRTSSSGRCSAGSRPSSWPCKRPRPRPDRSGGAGQRLTAPPDLRRAARLRRRSRAMDGPRRELSP